MNDRNQTANQAGAMAHASAGRSDLESLRREILSYHFEVERLIADFQVLESSNQQLAPHVEPVIRKHNELVRALASSSVWRMTGPLRRFVHRMRHGNELIEDFKEIRPVNATTKVSRRTDFPALPDLPQVGYVAMPTFARKSWETTRFHSFYYYNQLPEILARDPERSKKIFVQTSIIDWFVPLFQRPQHMALAMARQGYLVFYQTANMLNDRANGFHEVEPNVFLTNQPVHLMLENALLSFYSTVATLLSWQGEIIDRVRAKGNRVLYEYIDHIDPEISFHTTGALAKQFALVDDSTVDIGLASARSLCAELEEKLHSSPVVYVANGVDVDHYRRVADNDHRGTVPRELRAAVEAGKPIIGYFGALAPWLWYETINELAQKRPDLSFVYIGPDYLGASEKVAKAPNVFMLGAIDYMHLPYHAQHFDVCIIPFKPGDIAKTTSPLKLFEYFALGKPVVVTSAMAECVQFEEVLAADSVESYSQQIDVALRLARDESYVRKVRGLADANTWTERAAALADADRRFINSGSTKGLIAQ